MRPRQDRLWTLLDGRAWKDMDDAQVLLVSSKGVICEAANNNDYGKDCVVVGPDGKIAYDSYAFDRGWKWVA